MGLGSIVLVTTGQPSINPRIVKEANALTAAGYKVTLLYCYWINWAQEADKQLLKNVNWDYHMIGGDPHHESLLFFYTKVRFKLSRLLHRILGNRFLLSERSQARCYDALKKQACKIKADWYIGHNLGAISIVARAAIKNNSKCGFDFEDYHRGEDSNSSTAEYNRNVFLETTYVPMMSYLTAASPMIATKVKEDFPHYNKPVINIFNCFPKSEQPALRLKKQDEKVLHLFWFSQTIGKMRGLEIVLEALTLLKDPAIHLTLAGRVDPEFESFMHTQYSAISRNIHFTGTMEPGLLPALAASMDVGLALEPITPLNRDICLTNKIFTYLLSGTGIIFSNTSMQRSFNEKYNVGELMLSQNSEELALIIQQYKDVDFLNKRRIHNYQLASTIFNWEKEADKLLALVN